MGRCDRGLLGRRGGGLDGAADHRAAAIEHDRAVVPAETAAGADGRAANDIYTLENYRYFLFGSTDQTCSHWNSGPSARLRRSPSSAPRNRSPCSSFADLLSARLLHGAGGAGRRECGCLLLLLIVPYWLNEVLRAFAFRVLLGSDRRRDQQGAALEYLRPNRTSRSTSWASTWRLYAGLTYAYLLLMMFPLYNAHREPGPQRRSRPRVTWARPGGGSTRTWWCRSPSPASPRAARLVFMLTAGALATPIILSGPRTPVVHADRL